MMNKHEALNIKKFINELMEENYASANKYLQAVIDSKLKTRIERAKNTKIFK
tara:strand:- start:705 stop:860 length:156 start_codon:yes stop_codon:yes gene_type:complete